MAPKKKNAAILLGSLLGTIFINLTSLTFALLTYFTIAVLGTAAFLVYGVLSDPQRKMKHGLDRNQ